MLGIAYDSSLCHTVSVMTEVRCLSMCVIEKESYGGVRCPSICVIEKERVMVGYAALRFV